MISPEKYLSTPIGIETELNKFFNLKKELIVLDIGSCEGLDAIKYSRLFPNSKIYAFEALNSNYLSINDNIKSFKVKNIFPFNVALSNQNGEADFFVSSGEPDNDRNNKDWNYGNKSSSLLPPEKTLQVHDWLKFKQKERVKTLTLKSFCKNNKIKLIDFIHMDVQGAELMVLIGAEELISKIKMIWLEVENVELYKDQPLKQDVEKFMKSKGFTKIKDTVGQIAGDQLWVNLKFFPKKKITHLIYKSYEKLLSNRKALAVNDDFKKGHSSFAQSGEDLIIQYVFTARNYKCKNFIDIGANHPININNTYLFYLNGAKGVNIEPNPQLTELFKTYRKNDNNLNIGIGLKKEELDYYMFDVNTLNTFSKTDADNSIELGHKLINTLKIQLREINEILNDFFPTDEIDLLSLDVEGLDLEIIKSIDFTRFKPKIICVETLSYKLDGTGVKNEEIISHVVKQDYILYADTNINSILVRKDFWIK
jgi:FkbM family methyltransferase